MRVLLAFDDISLGGTSRTAILFARLWRSAGAAVIVYSPRDPHPDRLAELTSAGIPHITKLPTGEQFPDLVHLHHAAPSTATIEWVGNLLNHLHDNSVVLTHNVFGQDLPLNFPRNTIVGVLGDWLAAQYSFQTWSREKPVRIVPNPQDFRFFRPPTTTERIEARARLGISPDTKVLLRVGSPSVEKWSAAAYRDLAARVDREQGFSLRLIGVPAALTGLGATNLRNQPIALDDELRDEYWAADSFVHWAERGESFGNVILEALGTELPVTYMARPMRDNTPAEFRAIARFYYARNRPEWIESALRNTRALYAQNSPPDLNLSRYSGRTMQETLRSVVFEADKQGSDLSNIVLDALRAPEPLKMHEIAFVGVRHNAATALIKRLRLAHGS